MKYEFYGALHKAAKKILKRNNDLPNTVKLVDFPADKAVNGLFSADHAEYVNERKVGGSKIKKEDVYPLENLVNADFDAAYPLSFPKRKCSSRYASQIREAVPLWNMFLEASKIEAGYRNAGLHYAGYIKECQEWCLPSWIWTNAALVRYYCLAGEIEKAKKIGDLLIGQQQECGGWIVRNDYTKEGVSPQLAPNDSCYIALNGCLSLYDAIKEQKYLDAAIRSAQWTEQTARPDGMVWFAYDTRKKAWVKNRNIVDTGFTAGLFARLYEIKKEERYKNYLEKFVKAYVKAFYMPGQRCFSTAIDSKDCQYGGAFGRGQGWALEGLIPAYRVLKDEHLKKIIDACVATLLHRQLKNGGWSYNLLKPMMGEDCKAVPVIAKCLLAWYETGDQNPKILQAVEKALVWCARHTLLEGEAKGGIFSYTIEGAVVHHMYTSTAFVYGSSYALELYHAIQKRRL